MSGLVESSKRRLFPGRRRLFGLGANAAAFRRHKRERCNCEGETVYGQQAPHRPRVHNVLAAILHERAHLPATP
jgi:hypothetical protein